MSKYLLKGGFFFGDNIKSVGVPFFGHPKSNGFFVPEVNKERRIVRFYEVDIDAYKPVFLDDESLVSASIAELSVGSRCNILVLRDGKLLVLNADEPVDSRILRRFSESATLVELNIARHSPGTTQPELIALTSKVSRNLECTDETRIFFETSEIGLLVSSPPLWGEIVADPDRGMSFDEALQELLDWDRYELEEYLRTKPQRITVYWAAAYYCYREKFGMQEFLFVQGKKYLSDIILSTELRDRPDRYVFSSVVLYEFAELKSKRDRELPYEVDFHLADLLQGLIEEGVLPALIGAVVEVLTAVDNVLMAAGIDPIERLSLMVDCVAANASQQYQDYIISVCRGAVPELEGAQLRRAVQLLFGEREIEKYLASVDSRSGWRPLLSGLTRRLKELFLRSDLDAAEMEAGEDSSIRP